MKRVITVWLTVIFVGGPLAFLAGCEFNGDEDHGGKTPRAPGDRGHLIPGQDEKGFDAALEDKMERYFITYKTFSSAPFGMSLDAYVGSTTDRYMIERFVNENPDRLSFDAFCAQDPACADGMGVYRQIDGSTVVKEGLIKSMGRIWRLGDVRRRGLGRGVFPLRRAPGPGLSRAAGDRGPGAVYPASQGAPHRAHHPRLSPATWCGA